METTGNALAAPHSAGLPFLVRGVSMPVLPKPFFVLRASWNAARTVRRLNRTHTAVETQQRTLKHLLENIALTAYGRDVGITPGMNTAEFRARVPVRDHRQLEPYFARIKRGEPNVLWPGDCHWAVETAGTTGKAKWLPVTDELLTHFEEAEADALLYFTARIGDSDVFRGRHISLAPLLTLIPLNPSELPPESDAVAPASSHPTSPAWGAPQLAEPPTSLTTEPVEWSAKIEAIITRTLEMDITMLAGIPNWLLVFADAARGRAIAANKSGADLKSIWPNLQCVIHHGIPLSPFQDQLKRAAGPGINLQEIYYASEAFVAAQDAVAGSGLRLMEDSGVFYEFLPLRDFEESLPLTVAAKALSLEQVRLGENYVLLITTPAGLCRYVLDDIIRFVSIEPPRIIHVGRTQLRLNAFDENVLEKELTDSIVAVCQRHNWTITNFHVAPLFISSLTGQARGRHEWWIELQPGTNQTPTGPILAGHLDADLSSRCESYASKRARGPMEPPVVRLVMPGFFAHWLDYQKMWGGQKKMPRCRSDRLIADDLAAIACFNAD
jgi:hypothetical protein